MDPLTWTWEKVADCQADALFRMGQQVDPTGKSTAYDRDPASGAITGRTHRDALDNVVSRETTQYNALRQPVWHIDANNLGTRSIYDDQGNLLFRTEGIVVAEDGSEDASNAVTSSWTYRSDGQVESETDALNNTTTYEYDVRGFRTAEVSPPDDPAFPDVRARKTWHFDVAGRLDVSTDAAGHSTTYIYDSRNRVTEIRYGNGSKETMVYGTGADANLLKSKTDRDGVVTTFDYDAAGREFSRTEGAQDPIAAITTTTTYLEGTDLPQVVTRAGQKTEYVYDSRKRVIETRRWVDGTRYLAESTVYDAADRVAYTRDAFNRRTYNVYDDLDRVVRTIREAVAGGVPTGANLTTLPRITTANPAYVIEETSFDAGGRVLTTTDARGIVTKMGYDALGRVTDRWEAFGTADEGHWQTQYDVAGNRVVEIDPLGRETRFSYNSRNQLASQTVAFGTLDAATTAFTYTLTGQRASQTDPNGHTTQWTYGHCCDWLKDVTDPAGFVTSYTYTLGGKVATVTDPNGHVTTTHYDGLGRPFEQIDGRGKSSLTAFDDDLSDGIGLDASYAAELATLGNRVGFHAVAKANPLGETVVQVSDALGRPVLSIDQARHVSRISYDQQVTLPSGVVLLATAVTDPLGHTASRLGDGLGRIRQQVDALGKVSTMAYDSDGNLVGQLDANGVGMSFGYDFRNRRTSSVDSTGASTLTQFDAVGNILAVMDGFNHGTTFTYTARNQKKTEKDRLGNTTAFSYDPAGNLLTISDADNEARKTTVTPEVYEAGKTRYTYTERNQLLTETFPGATGGTRTYGYHPNGQLKTRLDQRGITTTYSYDGANRLTDRSYSDGTADHFVLDDAGRITSATASRSGVVVGRTYYPTGLIKSETTTWPFGISGTSTSATVNYEYDAANRGVTLGLPDGRSLSRTFTARNELESLTIGGQSIATLGYDNAGRRTSALYGNGLTDSRGFTDNNLLKTTMVGSVAAPLLSLEYAYDLNRRKTSETDNRDGALSVSMGYDDADRLTTWTTGGSPKLPTSRTWDLSAVGDWTKTTIDGVIENREHTPVHEVKTRNGTAVSYDAAGNLIRTAAGQGFLWDAENRLLAADTIPNADGAAYRATYTYDALGRRVSKTVFGTTTRYVYDGFRVIQEVDAPTVLPASAAADDGSLATLAHTPNGALIASDPDPTHAQPIRVNFQPLTTPIPSGWLADKGKDYAVRSNTLTYGWVEGGHPDGEIRHFMPLPQYDTLAQLGDPGAGWSWQIALPNGSYPVAVVCGDPTSIAHTNNITINGQSFEDETAGNAESVPDYNGGNFDLFTVQANITNGVLTIATDAGAYQPQICFVEIGVQGTTFSADDLLAMKAKVDAATARTGGSPFWNGNKPETRNYVWGSGIDELMAYQRINEAGTNVYYVHTNQQWSVMAVTNESGQVVERFQYTATGKRASDFAGANGRSLSGLTTGWTGRNHDEATGTIYFRNREWEPEYQFISRDPAGYVDGMSLYRGYFVPNGIDPEGMYNESATPGPMPVLGPEPTPPAPPPGLADMLTEARRQVSKNIAFGQALTPMAARLHAHWYKGSGADYNLGEFDTERVMYASVMNVARTTMISDVFKKIQRSVCKNGLSSVASGSAQDGEIYSRFDVIDPANGWVTVLGDHIVGNAASDIHYGMGNVHFTVKYKGKISESDGCMAKWDGMIIFQVWDIYTFNKEVTPGGGGASPHSNPELKALEVWGEAAPFRVFGFARPIRGLLQMDCASGALTPSDWKRDAE